jgi:hypothetical protein
LASTAGSISSCATPIAANRGTPFTSRCSPIPPLSRAWNSVRSCSSHASSSLVKMATDRDILSDEYVPYLSRYAPCKQDQC